MQIHTVKNTNLSADDQSGKKSGDRAAVMKFADNRPAAAIQRNLQKATDNSPQAIQTKAFQEMGAAGTTALIQLKTKINHETTTFAAEGKGQGDFTAGLGMQAILDPEDPVLGSATSNSTNKMMAICKLFNPNLEQTHLLNADLGGFGVYENLYPMTAAANREHFNQVESKIKKGLVFTENQVSETKGQKHPGIYYEVQVDGDHSHSGLSKGTDFQCESYLIDDVINDPVPNAEKEIAAAKITSSPTTDEAPKGFDGDNIASKNWSHKQGIKNPKSSLKQQFYIKNRQGKATEEESFTLYTEGKTWNDYRNNKISVDNDLDDDNITGTAKLALKPQKIQADLNALMEHAEDVDKKYAEAAKMLQDILESMISEGTEFDQDYYIETYLDPLEQDEFIDKLANNYRGYKW